jgi:hypothetical protein
LTLLDGGGGAFERKWKKTHTPFENIVRPGKKRIVSMGEKCLMSICTKLGSFEAFEPVSAHFDAI